MPRAVFIVRLNERPEEYMTDSLSCAKVMAGQ